MCMTFIRQITKNINRNEERKSSENKLWEHRLSVAVSFRLQVAAAASIDNAKLTANVDECGDAAVDLLVGVCGGDLHPNAGFPLRNNRIAEPDHINAFACANEGVNGWLLFRPPVAAARSDRAQ